VQTLVEHARKAAGEATVQTTSCGDSDAIGQASFGSVPSTPSTQKFGEKQSQSQCGNRSKKEKTRESNGEAGRSSWSQLEFEEYEKQRKTQELVEKTHQMKMRRLSKQQHSESIATTPASKKRVASAERSFRGIFSRRKSKAQQGVAEEEIEITLAPVRVSNNGVSKQSRSKSPFRRWRKTEDTVGDSSHNQGHVAAQTPSTAASCRGRQSVAARTPSTATTLSSRERRGRSKSPFRRWRNAEDLVNDIRQNEERMVIAQTPSTATSSRGRHSNAVSTPSTGTTGSSPERRSRSKSPFESWKKSSELIDDVNLVAKDFALELQREKSPLSARERAHVSPLRCNSKRKQLILDNQSDKTSEVEVVWDTPTRSALSALTRKLTVSAPSSPPKKALAVAPLMPTEIALSSKKSKSFSKRFRRTVTPGASQQSKAKMQTTASNAGEGPMTPPSKRSSALGKKARTKESTDNSKKGSPNSKRSIPKTIEKRGRSYVSDLSTPKLGDRCRSIGDDSALAIKRALSSDKLNHLRSSDVMSSLKSVSVVMETLYEVTDKLESDADRDTLLEVLSMLEEQTKEGAVVSRLAASGDADTRDSEEEYSDDDYDSEFDDETSFSRWDVTEPLITLQGLLGLFGLSRFFGDDASLIEAKDHAEDDADESLFSASATGVDYDETERSGVTPIYSRPIMSGSKSPRSAPRRHRLDDDEQTQNLVPDDEQMLRELADLDHKMNLEAERAKRKRIEAEKAERQRSEAEKILRKKAAEERAEQERIERELKESNSLKRRLEQRRKKQIELTENKAREAELSKQKGLVGAAARFREQDALKKQKFNFNLQQAAESAKSQQDAEKAEKEREMTKQHQAMEAANLKKLAMTETRKKIEEQQKATEAARRRKAEEEEQDKIEQQEAAKQRVKAADELKKSAAAEKVKAAAERQKKKLRADQAKGKLFEAKSAKKKRQEDDRRKQTSRTAQIVAALSSDASDSSISSPRTPPPSNRLSRYSSFRPRREDENSPSTATDTETRSASPLWDEDALSVGSLDSSEFVVPAQAKRGGPAGKPRK